jgi:hypothetical protein
MKHTSSRFKALSLFSHPLPFSAPVNDNNFVINVYDSSFDVRDFTRVLESEI